MTARATLSVQALAAEHFPKGLLIAKLELIKEKGLRFVIVRRMEKVELIGPSNLDYLCWKLHFEQGPQLSQVREETLLLAAGKGNTEVCEMLLIGGVDVNAQDGNGLTALDYAVESGNVETVGLLCTHGATVDVNFFLRSFEKLKCQQITELLIDCSMNSDYFIIYAMDCRRLDFIKWCFEINCNRLTKNKRLAFFLASLRGRKEMVAYLTPRVPSCAHARGLLASILNGHEDIVTMILDYWQEYRTHNIFGDNTTILHLAAKQGHVNLVQLFINKYNADVNFKSDKGETPLHSAAKNGNCKVIKLILDGGANVNDVNNENLSALHFCTLRGRVEAVELLLNCGADINHQENKNGETPLHIAVSKSFDQVAKVLIKHLVKIKLCGGFVSEKNSSALKISQELHLYYEKCEQELKILMEKKFVDSTLSYYSVCEIKDVNRLGAMASNENIAKVLGSVEFEKEFTIYGSMIVQHFERGIQTNKYFKRLVKLFKYVARRVSNRLPSLPHTCVHQIFTYLSNQDCINLLCL